MYNLSNHDLIFKCYRKGKSAKIPANKTAYSFDEVKDCENYGAICRDNIIDVSFDSIEMFDEFLNICEEQGVTTYALYSSKGGHSYWRYDNKLTHGKDKLTAGGFTVDIHGKGTYIPLRCDGELRGEVYDDTLTSVPNLPKWLYPMYDLKGDNPLWRLCDGEGRNDALSKHVFLLNKNLHFTESEIKETINLINNHVLKDVMMESELDTILRDETFDKMKADTFFDGNKFLHNVFGDYMIQKYKIVSIDKHLHMFNGEIYEYTDENNRIMNSMINEIPFIKDSNRQEVLKYIKIRTMKCEQADERYIAFKNGVYDLYTGELLPFSPNIYITVQIPWNYNPSSYSKIVDDTLNNIAVDDYDIRYLLEECVGYCFYRRNELGSSFFLIGDKSNGKSTFLKMIKNMLGKRNYSPLDLSELADRFNTAMMYGKLANIGDDIDDEYMHGSKVAIFKKLVTGDTIKAEEKGQTPFMFEPFAKLLFSANEMPRIKDKTGAVMRRIVIIPFNAVFDKNDPAFKHNIIKDLITTEATEYLIRLGVEGLHRILDRQNFTQPEVVKEQLKEYEKSNDTVMQFVEDLPNGLDDILNENTDDVFARYQTYCNKNGYKFVGVKNTFTSTLKKRYGIEVSRVRLNGKLVSIYKEAT